MQVDGRKIRVDPRVEPQVEQRLHSQLRKIDPTCDPLNWKAEDLHKSAAMKSWMLIHCTITPYSFYIRRCSNKDCCGEFRTPTENGVRDLAMQRQPTPIIDPTRKEFHYYRRDDALRLFGSKDKSCVDLTCLPSKNTEKEKEKESKSTKSKRDLAVTKKFDLKGSGIQRKCL